MNALAIGSFALIAVLVFIYWLSRMFRRDGASQQKDKNRENNSEYMDENHEDWYDGRIGTDALPMHKPGKWGKGAPADTRVRMEPGNGDVPKREKDGGKVHDA